MNGSIAAGKPFARATSSRLIVRTLPSVAEYRKTPCCASEVSTVRVCVLWLGWITCSKLVKKNSLPLRIGPPMFAPYSFSRSLFFGRPRALLSQLFALSASLRNWSKICQCRSLVPRRVTNCTCTAPSAPASAVRPAVETVTSSMAPSLTGANTKKLVSPLRKRCELLLMPSSVMLMAPPGSPLYVLNREPELVAVPGVSSAKPSTSRPDSGSFAICSSRTVVETVLDVVSTTGASACTFTCS